MELSFKGSFFRDLDVINNRYVATAIKEKITQIESAKKIAQISRLKQFRSRSKVWYKVEIVVKQNNKIYWMLCTIRNDAVVLRRIKPESYFKKNFK